MVAGSADARRGSRGCGGLVARLATSNGQEPHHIPLLVNEHSVDEGGVDGRVGWVEIASDRRNGLVVQAIALPQGEIDKKVPVAVEELSGAGAIVLEAFLKPRGKRRAGL